MIYQLFVGVPTAPRGGSEATPLAIYNSFAKFYVAKQLTDRQKGET